MQRIAPSRHAILSDWLAAAGLVTLLGVIALAGSSALHAQTSRSTWDGTYTAAQAARGQAVYDERCASCHGEDLGGRDMASPLAGADFLTNWDGLTLDDLFERIRTTMPADAPQSLTGAQYVDIVSYILSKNSFPTGTTELSGESAALATITIRASKP
jgi:mono/diheme cytochrome c family protein